MKAIASETGPLLDVKGLTKQYALGAGKMLLAVQDVSFAINAGEAVGLVGESGSGKSTIGKLLMRLETATSGEIWFQGRNLLQLSPKQLRPLRKSLQIVFQDPYASLNPRMRVGEFVAEPLEIHMPDMGRKQRKEKVAELFMSVGLDPSYMERYPFQFSGGQRQRIGIARALALGPDLIIADEPITALDVSTQAQIINIFLKLQSKFNLSYLFISHDLGMVRHLCHRVIVLLRGRIVETGPTRDVYANPAHPYTRSLISAMLDSDPERERGRTRETYDVEKFDNARNGVYSEVGPGHYVWQPEAIAS